MDLVFFCLSVALRLFTLYFVVVALFGLRRPRQFPPVAPATRFAVVVAARNEEAVIGNLAASLRAQDYPPELADLYVIPNNCTDGTERAAVRAGARIVRCYAPVAGKGDALHQAIEQLLPMGYDAFLILDADNTLRPGYLARLNDAFCAGAQVCKSRTVAANPRASAVAGCYGLYNACFDWIWSRPRAACGLSAKLIGTGFAVHSRVFRTLDGWHTETIAEDAEFAQTLAGHGIRVTWVPQAVNCDEEPTRFALSLRQRRRWCSGVMQVAKTCLPSLWRGKCPRPMLRVDITMQLLAPFVQAVSALLLFAGLFAGALRSDPRAALFCLAGLGLSWLGLLVCGAVLSLAGGYGLRGMGKSILLFPLFMASWMPLQVLALFHDTKTWRPIAHKGVVIVER